MRLLILALSLSLFALCASEDSTRYVGYVTKVKGISKTDIENRREAIIVKLNRDSETVVLDSNTGDGVDVLFNQSVIVQGREYTFAAEPGECTFGPLLSKNDKEVYLFQRDLTSDENEGYLKASSDTKESFVMTLTDGSLGDIIVPRLTTGEEDNGALKEDTKTFALVKPITYVAYDCEENTFCCGLRCCPTPLKQFLAKINAGNKRYEMTVPVDSEQNITLFLKPQPISNSTRNCGYVIDSDDYYPYAEDVDIDAVRYKCPKNFTCCADSFCCKITGPRAKEETFGTWIAGFKNILIAIFVACGLLFVIGLWYLCHYKRSARPPPHTYLAPEKRGSRASRVSRQTSRVSRTSELM